MSAAVQDRYSPAGICFGCGPANQRGLRIKSVEQAEGVLTCEWRPEAHHEAFPGMLAGGIVGTLLDCHSNWTAAVQIMKLRGEAQPPCTVTAEYTVKLLAPTPTSGPVQLESRIVEATQKKAVVEATLSAGGKVCATCHGVFVAVKPGHPAYHRW